MNNRYHTVEDARGQEFYQLPKDLIKNPKYKKLTANAKIAYAILRDRHSVSLKNRWVDEKNRVYFLFSDSELADILDMSIRSTNRYKLELQDYGLIVMERQGMNRRNRIYLLKVESYIAQEVLNEDTASLDRTNLSSPDKTVLSSSDRTELSILDRTNLSILSNNNLSNNNLSNIDEEYIYKLRSNNIFIDFLFDFLKEKGISDETAFKTINLFHMQGLENITAEDVEAQYRHMMEMKESGTRVFDFPQYFVTGLEMITEQTVANNIYQEQKRQQQANIEDIPMYNWLEDRSV